MTSVDTSRIVVMKWISDRMVLFVCDDNFVDVFVEHSEQDLSAEDDLGMEIAGGAIVDVVHDVSLSVIKRLQQD